MCFHVFQNREVVVKSKRHSASFVSSENWVALEEDSGKIFLVEMVDDMTKIKGLGVFNPSETIGDTEIGDEIIIGQKILTRLSPRLPELYKGMKRRAQTISAKDAGVLIARLGIGPGDVILEAGLGSGGLSLPQTHGEGRTVHHLRRLPGAPRSRTRPAVESLATAR